jgi:triacylglycerol esterase/lipase EstA (alpha/beta hydrolase family)
MSTAEDELGALTRLAFGEAGRLVGGIAGTHRAIADRAFGATGAAGSPARALHDGISAAVYAGLRGGAELAGRGASLAVTRVRSGAPPPSASARGALITGAVTGLIGDVLEQEGSPLAQPISVRVRGRRVEPAAGSLASAFPAASPRLVVFLHGLMETEFAWDMGSRETGGSYGDRLIEEIGCSALTVRYNSGRHISENGRSLAELLEEVTAHWPVEVTDIALVGHSMGGLVARGACYQAAVDGFGWVDCVRQVVSLGTPHFGAPLAQAVHLAAAALHALPESRAAGGFLRRRSAGIRDLRSGSLVDEDWSGHDPDALRARACRELPLLEDATHHFVSATVTRDARHPVGRLVGDWLVLEPSACGRGRSRRLAFRAEHGLHVGGVHHLALLNHPDVYERLRDWLGP